MKVTAYTKEEEQTATNTKHYKNLLTIEAIGEEHEIKNYLNFCMSYKPTKQDKILLEIGEGK